MPTFDVETNLRSPALERRFARRLSTWLARRGTPLAHTIVRYRQLDPARVYSGPVPFDRLPATGGSPNLAFVACRVSRDRPLAFREQLATFIVENLQPDISRERVFVEIRPVDPRDHVVGGRLAEEV